MAEPGPVILFGYDSSPFTNKIRLVLRLKQIRYTYVPVPSMMPRPVLRDTFGITYRKIPVLAIGRDVYCDTSLIVEVLEQRFPDKRSLYPDALGHRGQRLRPLIRGFASYWTDRPLFRVATGLIPARVWRTRFGKDRAGLIGHYLDPDKLERKRNENLIALDTQLKILAPLFEHSSSSDSAPQWILNTPHPSLADLSLYYQLNWLRDISRGIGIENLTGGGTADTDTDGADTIFTAERFPGLWSWFFRFRAWIEAQASVETVSTQSAVEWREALRTCELRDHPLYAHEILISTAAQGALKELQEKCGLLAEAEVSVVPDDTGRDSPTFGRLLALSSEEVTILPRPSINKGSGDNDGQIPVRVHFPRIGFVIRPLRGQQPQFKL